MKNLRSIEIRSSKEEVLPDFSADFPYIATCAELDRYPELQAPWHWHKTAELFYVQSGILEFTTPQGKWVFPAGSGGFVNANVLHTSRVIPSAERAVQLLHQFDPALLAGEHGSRMETKYILPLTAADRVEMLPLSPKDPRQAQILTWVQDAFSLQEEEFGYEFRLREALSRIWLALLELARPVMGPENGRRNDDSQIKLLMAYIQEHLQEPISADQLAQAAHISKRACFRLFEENLHMPPGVYIRSCRLRRASALLAKTNASITDIAYACGLGSSSYFGKRFREAFGCTPQEYRKHWHDRDKNRQ